MLLATWNVNSLRARMPRVLEFIATHRPDVLCLQETKCTPGGFPGVELAAAGYRAVDLSGGQWAGVAILARDGLPMGEPVCGLAGDPVPSEARWIEATVEGVRVASVYVPNGRALDSPEYPRKLAFLEAMAQRAAALDVIAGDFNIAPADLDVYDPALFVGGTHVSTAERQLLAEIERRGALTDAFRHLHPQTPQYTWWDYRAGHFHKGLGLRIDLVLLAERLIPSLTSCGIDRDFRKGQKPSDHAPLLVRF
jgi:exodeoxyribonuclease-3